ncbi:MAG: hypothetical protein NC127_00185 [Muribaculum sp.]|nr:hypothetical protein [Muribaculum sp.]
MISSLSACGNSKSHDDEEEVTGGGNSSETVTSALVGKWKYTNAEQVYYIVEEFKSTGAYSYEEYDLGTNKKEESGSGNYSYDEETKILKINVTSGNDAPYSMRVHCVVNGDEMQYRDLDEDKATLIYQRMK